MNTTTTPTTLAGLAGERALAAQDALDVELLAEVELHGRSWAVFAYTYTQGGSGRTYHRRVMYGGSGWCCTAPTGDGAALVKKLTASLELAEADAQLLPLLRRLVRTAGPADERRPVEPVEGAVAYVYAMGRARRGLVVKVTKTKATVAYTTASSNGRVFRKAVSRDLLVTWDAP